MQETKCHQEKLSGLTKKGYGFIKEQDTDRDIFLHISALEKSKLRILKEDQKLIFDIKKDKNRLQAINLKKLNLSRGGAAW